MNISDIYIDEKINSLVIYNAIIISFSVIFPLVFIFKFYFKQVQIQPIGKLWKHLPGEVFHEMTKLIILKKKHCTILVKNVDIIFAIIYCKLAYVARNVLLCNYSLQNYIFSPLCNENLLYLQLLIAKLYIFVMKQLLIFVTN